MSGRSRAFWFGMKASCKEFGFGFACIWERDWDNWFYCWKKNVHCYSPSTCTSIKRIVLVDTEVDHVSKLGRAQRKEVAYLQKKGLSFEFRTNEEFVYFLEIKK